MINCFKRNELIALTIVINITCIIAIVTDLPAQMKHREIRGWKYFKETPGSVESVLTFLSKKKTDNRSKENSKHCL